MNINSLTIKAQEALQQAFQIAASRSQQAVEPAHILAALVEDDSSLASFLLSRVGVNVKNVQAEVQSAVNNLPTVSGGGEQFFAQSSSRVIQRAIDFTKTFGDKYASVEHILLGLIAEPGDMSKLLKQAGATEKDE